jgi:hypothetical protein
VVRGKREGDVSRQNQVVRISRDDPVQSVTMLVSGLGDILFQVVVRQRDADTLGVGMVGFVEMYVKVTEDEEFGGENAAMVKQSVKVSQEHGEGQFVASAWGRAVEAGKQDGACGEFQISFNELKRRVGEGKGLGE